MQPHLSGNLSLLVVQRAQHVAPPVGESFSPRSTKSSACSPTKVPLQAVVWLPTAECTAVFHPATQQHLLGTNALRCARVNSHRVAAPDHSIEHTPTTVPALAIVALPLSAVYPPRSERTAVHASLARMREIFHHGYISTLPHT